jgi:two-component system, chemotaxis family, sensor kinase CheA
MKIDQQMARLFVEEATDLLADFEQAMLLLKSLPDDLELLGRIFRDAHTLKGNARMLGLEAVAAFTHQLDNLLDKLRKQELVVTQSVANTLFTSLDLLKVLVAEVAGGPAHDASHYQQTRSRIEALVADLHREFPVALEQPAFELPQEQTPAREPRGELVAEVVAPPREVEPRPAAAPRTESALPLLPAQVPPAISNDAPTVAEAPRAPKGPPAPFRERRVAEGESNSVRVPIEKLDRLINLTGEVVIAQSMIAQLMSELTPENVSSLQELVAQMERHCRELQERMLGARMLPIKTVFARFNRMIRDLSAANGKELCMEVSGEDTELDKTVIEKIADPLTHLVRNAVDHGIESPEERRAAGKPEKATLRLAAYQKGGKVFIDVSDDGRGLDRDKILDKGRRLGLISADAQPSDDEIHKLIFQAGFSTAEQVTEISGRGVGMDVVRRNVESLKGTIVIITRRGLGTTFRITLPLTLAILDGLGVRVGGQVYLVPMMAVVESLQPPASDVCKIANLGEVVDVRGEYLPLVRLYELFGVAPVHRAAHEGLVMVVEDGTHKVALQVDELIGQYQVVIKSLEANFKAVPGVSGATVLGDGRVALILDTANLAGMASARELHLSIREQALPAPVQQAIGSQQS